MVSFKERLLAVVNQNVWDGLPEELRNVPDEVESVTGIRLEILPKELCDQPVAAFDKAEAVIDIDGHSQRITIWCDPGSLKSSVLGHELIHLRRDILERVPKLIPVRCSPYDSGLIHMIENELEHLFIIPEEIQLFSDAEERWASHYSDLVDRIIQRSNPDHSELAITWMQLRHSLPDQVDIAKRLFAHIREQGEQCAGQANDLRCLADEDRTDKGALVLMMTESLSTWYPSLRSHLGRGRWGSSGGEMMFMLQGVGDLNLAPF